MKNECRYKALYIIKQENLQPKQKRYTTKKNETPF